ncbi:MAG TPA: SDR family NAD(P)-dependent oxidoreductase [Bacteroidales bacterium]|nr:SDR family NAD(P)-dependent oxidoreductase [Bacteroidales bacterium]
MDKTVLITGAAHGLGGALVRRFAEEGWRVIATDADDLSMAWMLEYPGIIVLPMDVTSDESVTEAFNRVREQGIPLDAVINNAGIDRYFPLSEAPASSFREVFEVNVFGAYRVNQTFLPVIRRPGGRIIQISSESLNLTMPFMPYPLSKKLAEGYAKALRQELRFLRIDVVIIRPGAIRTRLLQTVSTLDPAANGWRLAKPFSRFAAAAPGRIGNTLTPEKAAAFIFSKTVAPRPSAVYRINNMLALKVSAMIPFGWMEMIVHRMLAEKK